MRGFCRVVSKVTICLWFNRITLCWIMEGTQNWVRAASEKAVTTIQGEGDCVLSQRGGTRVGEKCSDSGYKLKVESTRFAGDYIQNVRKGEGSRMTLRFLLGPFKGWSYHLSSWGEGDKIRFEREHHEFSFGYAEFDIVTTLLSGDIEWAAGYMTLEFRNVRLG